MPAESDTIGELVLRAIAETTTDAIIVADAEGMILRFNRAAEQMFGHDEHNVIGKPLTILMPVRYREAHTQGLARLRETGEAKIAGRVIELEALHKDGREIAIELTVCVVEQDLRKQFLGIARDVTRRRRAEDALRHSEAGFRKLVQSSPEPLMVCRAGFLLYVNGALQRMLGYTTTDQLVGRRLVDQLIAEPDRARTDGWLRTLSEGQVTPSALLVRALRVDGGAIDLECRGVSLDFEGAPATVVLARDVTEERAAADEIRKLMMFLDSIIENIPNMIFVKEARELRFERFNRAGEELLGIPRSELLGKNDYDFFPREQADFFQARDRETLEGDTVVDIPEEPIDTRRGQRWLHTKKIPIKDATGKPLYLLGISEDITERRQQLAELEQARRSAEILNRELEAFSYSVAHDLRAPLRAMDGFSLALLEDYGDKLDAQGRDYLERVRAGSQHMASLIEDLLSLAKLSCTTIQRASISLSTLAYEVVTALRAAEPERQVEACIEPGLETQADPILTGVVLQNLLSNAWKFTARCDVARVELGRTETEHGPMFFVRDNGAGFDMSHADKLFDAFQRLHASRDYPGTGIGLATVKRIVARHGGRIWAEAKPGKGATFYFSFDGADS